jgi:hypothetical protein
MTRKHLYTILLIALSSILFVCFLATRTRTQRNQIESFEDPGAVKGMKTVLQNYNELQKQLTTANKLDTPYNSVPLSDLVNNTQQELKTMIELYLDHKATYADCKKKLKQMVKDFNEIIRLQNVNLLNLNIEMLMPELPIQKASLESPVYASQDEYGVSSDKDTTSTM